MKTESLVAATGLFVFALLAISGCGEGNMVTLGPSTSPGKAAELCAGVFGSDQAVSSQFKPGTAEPLHLKPKSVNTRYRYSPSSHTPFLACDYGPSTGTSPPLLLVISGPLGGRTGTTWGRPHQFFGHRVGALVASATDSAYGYSLPLSSTLWLTNVTKRIEVGP